MTTTKCQPTKVQCNHSPGSLLFETQEEVLDVGYCCNQKNSANSVLHVLFDAFSRNAFHFSLILSHLTNWRTGCCWRMIHATVRHTCKAKSSGKLQSSFRHFRGPQPPPPSKIIVAVLYSSLKLRHPTTSLPWVWVWVTSGGRVTHGPPGDVSPVGDMAGKGHVAEGSRMACGGSEMNGLADD